MLRSTLWFYIIVLFAPVTITVVEVNASCSGRRVLTDRKGDITDGPGNYSNQTHCEWLIDASDPALSIILSFTTLMTECSFDFLFIYDGDSYDSPLIASLSGDHVPKPVISRSGYMLVHLFSDRNTEMSGFTATYEILYCSPMSTACFCLESAAPTTCNEEPSIPIPCNPNGTVNQTSTPCECKDGWAGEACNFQYTKHDGLNMWYQLMFEQSLMTTRSDDTRNIFISRAAHAGAFIDRRNSLWIFGGLTLSVILDDLIVFDLSLADSKWQIVHRTEPWPEARHSHAIAAAAGSTTGFYMYGGVLADNSLSDELWFYDVINVRWRRIEALNHDNILHTPPPLAGHTLTLAADYIILFGGRFRSGKFSSDMFRIRDTLEPAAWEKIQAKSGRVSDLRSVGHTTVYHHMTQSLLVLGGFRPTSARFSHPSDRMNLFNLQTRVWSHIMFYTPAKSAHNYSPGEIAYHSAVVVADYMVVFGGNRRYSSILGNDDQMTDVCFNSAIFYYHIGCNTWVDPNTFVKKSLNRSPSPRFSHLGVLAYGNTLIVAGGYGGYMKDDLWVLEFPWAVTSQSASPDHCTSYKTSAPGMQCLKDPACGICTISSDKSYCMHKLNKDLCGYVFQPANCSGVCESLDNCASCVIQKGTVSGNWVFAKARSCHWCVKEATCQNQEASEGVCKSETLTYTGTPGWWNALSKKLTQMGQCYHDDKPAGLFWIEYRHPANFTFPDQVSVARVLDRALVFKRDSHHKALDGGDYYGQYLGYIYPIIPELTDRSSLKLWARISYSSVQVDLSNNSKRENKERVITGTAQSTKPIVSERKPLFPHSSGVNKYYVQWLSTKNIPKGQEKAQPSDALLQSNLINNKRHVLSFEFLEPYTSDGSPCSNATNCLQCMTDAACGWCSHTSTCMNRFVTDGRTDCGIAGIQHLVMTASLCPLCLEHTDCWSCANDELCEWLQEVPACTRRGKVDSAIKHPVKCHPSCHLHSACESCIGSESECAWCENLQTCFPFSEYKARFVYGHCTEWKDNLSKALCHNCSRHLTCKTCLADFQCGWCGDDVNPTIGVCLSGDFAGPKRSESCPVLVASAHSERSRHDNASWSYGVCPDVEECILGLHDCHANATCENTVDSYHCTCNQGFDGNGKTNCTKTCQHPCMNGYCTGPPDYLCNCSLGWTGDTCNISCGCNSHSTCTTGIGVCDACQQYTTGEHCQLCRVGSYGNPTDPAGCTECFCNGHSDTDLGHCDNITGKCYCTDQTTGYTCQVCQDGYYGDPRHSGRCYSECSNRTVLTDAVHGHIGTYSGPGAAHPLSRYCLWIISAYSSIPETPGADISGGRPASITFTMEAIGQINCEYEQVLIYDGVPTYSSSSRRHFKQIASFCGSDACSMIPLSADGNETICTMTVTAQTGIMTVFFNASANGFNASYHVSRCPDLCHANKECNSDNECQCLSGFYGVECMKEMCPGNCSEDKGQGHCLKPDSTDWSRCQCSSNYGGSSCDVDLTSLSDPSFWGHITHLSPPRLQGVEPRLGATLVDCGTDDGVYLYGGYSSIHGAIEHLDWYNVTEDTWSRVDVDRFDSSYPMEAQRRYFHSAVCLPNLRLLYVFGGLTHSGLQPTAFKATHHLMKFNLDSKYWTSELTQTPDWLPAIAGHTLTRVNDTKLILIGGFSAHRYYSSGVYMFDASSSHRWKELHCTGEVPIGIYGHSAIYDHVTETIYVYGGFLYKSSKFAVSNLLYAFDVALNEWHLLPTDQENVPLGRYFHSAVNAGSWMLVLGGRLKDGTATGDILAYNYRCNHWINLTHKGSEAILGESFSALFGASAIKVDNDIFIFGGYNGFAHNSMVKLTLPEDLCMLIHDLTLCTEIRGCSACVIGTNTGSNITYCFASDAIVPSVCSSNMTRVYSGTVCNQVWYGQINCSNYNSCSQCLAVNPYFKSATPVCRWCAAVCKHSQCIRQSQSCNKVKECTSEIATNAQCKEQENERCQYADCETCSAHTQNRKSCIWTRKSWRTSEVGKKVTQTPGHTWNCMPQSPIMFTVEPTPLPCPTSCVRHTSCDECLSSAGAEGGDQHCVWTETLQKCLPPASRPLLCSAGECGVFTDPCPLSCDQHTACSACLRSPRCGWCSLQGENGLGVCMPGLPYGPTPGLATCSAYNVSLAKKTFSAGPVDWSFLDCPPENECENQHHNCNSETERCKDREHGFECECKTGYKRKGGTGRCEPVCNQGCAPGHGNCVRPDVCECYFGWVGNNCSVECLCNKHSNCESVIKKDKCLRCHNNTQGQHCEKCLPFYVGNPIDGGACMSCLQFCYNHSDLCMNQSELQMFRERGLVLNKDKLASHIPHGPSDSNAVCVHCDHNTTSDRCNMCKKGHFRVKKKTTLSDSCMKCQCHGHSDTCEADTGEQCYCRNNTETKCNKESVTECWRSQCSACKEYFLGTPTRGHQCYRTMTVELDYCFDPDTQNRCSLNPAALLPGRTVFFAVQPRFLNVDIRITIDVTDGTVDVFFSPKEDTFLVLTDPSSGRHHISIDPSYHVVFLSAESRKYFYNMRPPPQHRRKRDAQNVTEFFLVDTYRANDLNTYVTVNQRNTILLVRNVKFRLIITLPQPVHDLQKSRFYVVVQSRRHPEDEGNRTIGNLYFRQDQPRIDLFVFFSVFFSCFFLFLAKCVLLWKVKQTFDSRRSRQQRAREMQHMASRPFAKVLMYIELDETPLLSQAAALPVTFQMTRRPGILPRFLTRASTGVSPDSPTLPPISSAQQSQSVQPLQTAAHLPPIRDETVQYFNVVPIAIEPTDDGLAAVGTVILQLPGGMAGHTRLCIGSALMTKILPANVIQNSTQQKGAVPLRRRHSGGTSYA